MITPFTEDGAVDHVSLQVLVEYLREQVDGLFVTGSYGAGAMMSIEERKAVTEQSVRFCGGKVPVITMVGTTTTHESVILARHAEASGAAAVAAVGPYYFKHGTDALVRFYDALVRAVDIPVYVYNNPKFQGYPMDLSVIRALRDVGVQGVKDATFDIMAHADYQRLLAPDGFDVVLGTEAMWLSARVLGCQAFIPGLGNAFPELCGKMYREGMEGRIEECRNTQFLVNRVREIMYHARGTQLAVYAMLEMRGIISAHPRAPFQSATAEEKEAIRRDLEEIGLI